MSNEYRDSINDKLLDQADHEAINEENLRKLQEIENVKFASSSIFKTEIFIDGVYSPSVVVSTNPETEFVTISFASITGTKAISATLTKKQFLNFTKELSHFAAAFLNPEENKKLIKG